MRYVQAPSEKRDGVIENDRAAADVMRDVARAERSIVCPFRSAGRATTRDETEESWRSARKADIVNSVKGG